MRRPLIGLFLLSAALPARGHFIFLLPPTDAHPQVRMVFSDGLEPDENADLLDKIKQTKVFAIGAKGEPKPVTFAKKGDALTLDAAKDANVLAATCRYGLFRRGESEPMLLHYYAKALTGRPSADTAKAQRGTSSQLDLDVALAEAPNTCRVLWKGKPLGKTKVFVTAPGGKSEETTEEDGTITLSKLKGDGLVALRVGHTVSEPGELDGKKYAGTRHWATFVFHTAHLGQGRADRRTEKNPVAAKEDRKENPDATRLLADARAARANWDHFPGFSADLELNHEGKVTKGKIDVDAKGKVTLEGVDDKQVEMWTRRQLSSIVGHRMADSGELKTPCCFTEDDAHHPLGRAIQVLNDEFHSSYRIRDRQVIVVNRTMKDNRFTITVMENKVNAEKQFLPAHYVVNSWDLKTNALRSSQTFFHEWTRVGKYDLPGTSMVLTATSDGKLEARKMTLTNHKLK